MNNIVLLQIAILLTISENIFAQAKGNQPTDMGKKYSFNIGASCKDGYKNFGGNCKLDFLKSSKTGLGFKTVATNNRFTFQMDAKSKTGLYLLCDLTLTHYFIGDYFKSSGGLYFDFGLGYQLEKLNILHDRTGSAYTTHFTAQGLGGHASLGGSFKIGRGRIYSEIVLGDILLGTYQRIAKYPENYPLNKNWRNESGHGTVIDLPSDGILALNFGYNYCF